MLSSEIFGDPIDIEGGQKEPLEPLCFVWIIKYKWNEKSLHNKC